MPRRFSLQHSFLGTLLNSESLSEFLSEFLKEKKKFRRGFTLRKWSSNLGYSNPSILSDVIRKKRRAPDSLLDSIQSYFKFDELEARYFRNLVLLDTETNIDTRKFIIENNESIKAYILSGIVQQEEIDALDLILIEKMRNQNSLSFETLYNELEEVFTEEELQSRVSRLCSIKVLSQENSSIRFQSIPKKFAMEGSHFRSYFGLAQKLSDKKVLKRNSILTAELDDETYHQITSRLLEAHRDISLMIDQKESEKKVATKPRKLRVFSSHHFSLK